MSPDDPVFFRFFSGPVTHPFVSTPADASVLMAFETGLGGLSPRPFLARTTTKTVSEGERSPMVKAGSNPRPGAVIQCVGASPEAL